MSNIKRYNIDEISKLNANYNLIYGEKANGKSYQAKHKKAVKHYIKTKRRFILMRRWTDDLSKDWVKSYFKDVDVMSLTNNKYDGIIKVGFGLFFSKTTEDFKEKKGEQIGYAIPLSLEQRFSSGSFLDVDYIIFEEFMSRTSYLSKEASKLETFYDTVDRKQGKLQVWLIGNTVSRISPYLNEWGLTSILKKQKQGDIDLIEKVSYDDLGRKHVVKIAIEYCKSANNKHTAFGNASSMINSGDWQSDPQPKLPKNYKDYKVSYRFAFLYKGFGFTCEYLKEKKGNNYVWFIHPQTREIKDKTLVFSDEIKTSPYYQTDIYNPLIKNERLKKLLYNFRESNIFYSDDLTGTDFKQSINFLIRK